MLLSVPGGFPELAPNKHAIDNYYWLTDYKVQMAHEETKLQTLDSYGRFFFTQISASLVDHQFPEAAIQVYSHLL